MTKSRFELELEAREQALHETRLAAERGNRLLRIYAAFAGEGLVPCAANDAIIAEHLGDDHLTAPDFKFAVENSPGFRDSLSWTTESQVRKRNADTLARDKRILVDEIRELLKNARDEFSLDQEIRRLSLPGVTIADLKRRKEEIERKQHFASMSHEELRKTVRRPPPPGFPMFPKTLVLPGSVTPTVIDRAFLIQLAKADVLEFKRLKKLYGDQQLDDRLNGRD